MNDSDLSYLGQTCLHLGAKHHQLPIVAFLVEASADPTLTDADGNTPLHLAVRNCYEYLETVTETDKSIVSALLGAHADATQPNDNDTTPLVLAVKVLSVKSVGREGIGRVLEGAW